MDPTSDTPDYEACVMRGRALLSRSRHEDAAQWFRRGIQIEPDVSACYALLAICLMNIKGRHAEAVDVARRAVSIEPEDCFNRCILSLRLGSMAKDGQDGILREALAQAHEAARLDPDSELAHTTLGRAQLRLQKWPEAEASARKALELDTDDATAAEVLSAALLHQGKAGDHDDLVRVQLQNNAESDSAHASAGWNALRKGDYKKANEHFMESLRLNPLHEGARLGLIESYRARSFFYRGLIQFDAFISRITAGRQMAFWLVGYLIYRVAYTNLKTTAPWAAGVLAGCWLLLIFWSHLSRGLSSFFMLFDHFARRSLRASEKWEGIVVGGMAVLALGFFVASFFAGRTSVLFQLVALCFFVSALPAASAFTNDHYIGKWVYWAVAVFCIGCAMYPVVMLVLTFGFAMKVDPGFDVMLWGIYTAVGFSFVRMFGIGYR